MKSLKDTKNNGWEKYSNFDVDFDTKQEALKKLLDNFNDDIINTYLSPGISNEPTATKAKEEASSPHIYFINKAVEQLAKSKKIFIKNIDYSTPGYSFFQDRCYKLTFEVEDPQSIYTTIITLDIDEKAFNVDKIFIDKDCGLLNNTRELDDETKMIIRWGYVLWKAYSKTIDPSISGKRFSEIDFSINKDIRINHFEREITNNLEEPYARLFGNYF